MLSRNDLRTGTLIGDRLELPWLDPISGASAGDTIYTLGSVVWKPRRISYDAVEREKGAVCRKLRVDGEHSLRHRTSSTRH